MEAIPNFFKPHLLKDLKVTYLIFEGKLSVEWELIKVVFHIDVADFIVSISSLSKSSNR